MTTLHTWLTKATHTLSSHTDTARLEAELLLGFTVKKDRAFLYAHLEDVLTAAQLETLHRLLQKRLTGYPLAYLIGKRDFWSFTLTVNEHTLIPRSDTETLVEACLENHTPTQHILELGTGTGAMAIAIALERPQWSVTATDVSEQALLAAQSNAARLNVRHIDFKLGHWFEPVSGLRFDQIISNPPYLKAEDPHLQQGDLRFEPQHALVAGPDGLDAIRHLITHAPTHLHKEGFILLEHGFDQSTEVARLMTQAGFSHVEPIRDLSGVIRVTKAQLRT